MPEVSRYSAWQVAPPPPTCVRGACRRWLVERAGSPRGDLPDRFLVDARTPVETRVSWLLRLVEQGAGRDAATFAGIAAVCERHSAAPTTPRTLGQALLEAQNALITYLPDRDGQEVFQGARFSYFARTGDCEDKAVFFASVARLLGLEADVVWIDQPGAANNHVTARVCLVHRNGSLVDDVPRPWDDTDPGRVRVTGAAVPVGCRYAWAEPTLRGALIGENPYDVLRRLGTGSPNRPNL